MLWKMTKNLFGTGRRKLLAVLLGVSAMLLLSTGNAFAQDAPPTVDELARGINTVWVLVAAFLVFFMQAGFSLVEAGFTRSKNTINILFKNVADFLLATIAYWAIGYALMFGEGSPFIGMTGFFLTGLESDTAGIPTMAVWIFQLVFAGTAATIVSGAMAERTRIQAYLIYTLVLSLLIYPIFGHWVWGGGWLTELGFLDFAGSTVVHSVGGWAALVGAIMVGPRLGKFNKDGSANVITGHSIALGTLGVFILWLGWFGFNPGSQLAAVGGNADTIALVAVNTNLGAAAGGIAALLLKWLRSGKADLSMTLNGVLGGLVAVTAPCAFITPLASIIIGLVGGAVIFATVPMLERFKIDDPVGAVPVHLFNGIWGTIALGLFHTESGLLTTGSGSLIVAQLIGIVACGVWTGLTSAAMFYAIKATIGLRVSAAEEEAGLDFEEHGSIAYPDLVPELGTTTTPVTSGSTVTAIS